MNIIYVNWDCYCSYDACLALRSLGHTVQVIDLPDSAINSIDESFIHTLTKSIKAMHCDAVLSYNYYPSISHACQQSDCHYISIIYDNPVLNVYEQSVTNLCNHIYTFDSHMARTLQQRGVDTIHYAPLAVNVSRVTQTIAAAGSNQSYACDISFTGSLYTKEHTLYDRLLAKANNPYLRGYLEGLLQAQKHVHGYNLLADSLSPEAVSIIRQHMPFASDAHPFIREEEVYADYYLARHLATIDRIELLCALSEYFSVHLYSTANAPFEKVHSHGTINYFDEMPLLFSQSRINLNPTLRSIKNGIPLRAMDIMGCGGFLLTNFQEDLLQHFEEDVHFCAYSSLEEAITKADYYLSHEDARRQIAQNAQKAVAKEHTFELRFQQILNDCI